MLFNSNLILSKIVDANGLGGYYDMTHTGDATTTGRISNIKAKQTKEITITLTSTTAFEVKVNGTTEGTGTVGTRYTGTAIEFDTSGVFATGEKFAFTSYAPMQVIKNDGTELVLKATRNNTNIWLGFKKKVFTAGEFLRIYIMQSYNVDNLLDAQPNAATASCPMQPDFEIDGMIRNTGTALILRIKTAASCDWLAGGWLDSVLDPNAFALPVFVGGSCDDSAIQSNGTYTRTAFYCSTVANNFKVRKPNGEFISVAPISNSGGNNIEVMPLLAINLYGFEFEANPDAIAEMDLIVAEQGGSTGQREVGIYGSLPALYLGYMNLSPSTEFFTKTKKMRISWSGSTYEKQTVVLFDGGLQ